MKHVLMSIALLALTACGFEPMHSRDYQARGAGTVLAAIEIKTPGGILGELLRAEIEDAVNPDYRVMAPAYVLNITYVETDYPLFINPDGTSERGEMRYDSDYTLTRLSDNAVIHTGKLRRVGSYNSSQTADYAAYVSKEDAKKRAIIEMAQDYKLRLANLSAKLAP
ncbi:MAG: hypothetical protein J0M34_07400 [Alphaproteobacteria bacterium]|nr:hypothetical protein [Alphaproteobacteria bacterium]